MNKMYKLMKEKRAGAIEVGISNLYACPVDPTRPYYLVEATKDEIVTWAAKKVAGLVEYHQRVNNYDEGVTSDPLLDSPDPSPAVDPRHLDPFEELYVYGEGIPCLCLIKEGITIDDWTWENKDWKDHSEPFGRGEYGVAQVVIK